jgi:hypothetical protein
MIVFMRNRIGLTEAERVELSQRAARRSGRVDVVEHPQAGFGAVDLAYDGGADMGEARIEAAAARPLHGVE